MKDWPLWEVFVRSRRGLSHGHVGSLHAPDAQMALRNDDAEDGVPLVVALQRLFALEVAEAVLEADSPDSAGEAEAATPIKLPAGKS